MDFLKRIKAGIQGAGETLKLQSQTRANNKTINSNIEKIGVQLAKKDFAKKYPGQTMSDNRLATEATAGGWSGPTKDYLANKKRIIEEKRKKYSM